jgi:uncharacterized protein (TIGR02271 family)
MPTETIVAVYDTPAHAELAIADLQTAGIPATSIQHYTKDHYGDRTYDPAQDTGKSEGLWGWLFGEDHVATHGATYDHSLQSGSTVVTVVAETAHADRILAILEDHKPIDLEERATQIGAAPVRTNTGVGHDMTASTGVASPSKGTGTGTEQVIPLAEETIQVGKREIDRGTTHVRRYVVERPVEEQVRLRDERVAVFRRPATGAAIGADAFTDKSVSVTETAEEAVIGKTARVVEEVVVQKNVEERAETVRDTVRREEVEITGPHKVA